MRKRIETDTRGIVLHKVVILSAVAIPRNICLVFSSPVQYMSNPRVMIKRVEYLLLFLHGCMRRQMFQANFLVIVVGDGSDCQ